MIDVLIDTRLPFLYVCLFKIAKKYICIKKSCFETVLSSPAVYTCLPQGFGESRFQWGLPVEGRQSHGGARSLSGVLGRTGSPGQG